MRTGVTNKTYESMYIGPGAVYKGFVNAASPGTIIAATTGGNKYNIEREFYAPEIDGMLGPVKGTERLIKEVPSITANFIEIRKEVLLLALPGTKAATGASHDTITSDGAVSEGNYVDIAIVGDITTKGQPIIFVCRNALATQPVEINTGNGKEDVALQVTFVGHYNSASPSVVPYDILTPNI